MDGERRKIGVADAVRWAYREELPKAPRRGPGLKAMGLGRAWAGVEAFGELMAVVDDEGVNHYGVIADLMAVSLPHDDAIAIHEAVLALDAWEVEIPQDWSPLEDADLGEAGAACVARALARLCFTGAGGALRPRERMSDLVLRCAILGAPDWTLPPCRLREVTGADGRARWFRRVAVATDGAFGLASYEAEVDGWCSRARRPHADAYRKFAWDPDPMDTIVERGRHELWHAALGEVAGALKGRLSSLVLTGPAGSARPWVDGAGVQRVWPNLLTAGPAQVEGQRVARTPKRARGKVVESA